MLSIEDLQGKKIERIKQNKQLYKNILYNACLRIQNNDNIKKSNLVFRIPTYIIGHSSYNMINCLRYITKKLIQRGFFVYPYKENYLYIDWSLGLDIESIKKKKQNDTSNTETFKVNQLSDDILDLRTKQMSKKY